MEVSGLFRFYICLAKVYDKQMTFSMQICVKRRYKCKKCSKENTLLL